MRTTKAATSPAPFKGDSFPSYVLQRVARGGNSGGSSSLQLNDGPSFNSAAATATAASKTASQLASPTSPSASSISAITSVHSATARGRTPQQVALSSPLGSALSSSRSRSFQQRPSLSEQLKAISQNAQEITAQLKTSYSIHNATSSPSSMATRASASALELQATTIGMSVGKLECRFPCPVRFLQDHCTYVFQHPYEAKEIQMVMYYRDMTQVHVSLRDKSFQFRITRALEQFGDDYRPANPQHVIRIVLATVSEAQRVKQFIAEQRLWFTAAT